MALTEDEEFELLSLEREKAMSSRPGQEQQDSASNLWGSSPELRTALDSSSPIWNSLQVPSQMASRGLKAIAGAVPEPEMTGNLPVDLVKSVPKVAANTLSEAAPGFVSRAAMLTGGAAKAANWAAPAVRAIGRGIANQADSITGAAEGATLGAFRDPTLIFAKGKEAARPFYEAAKAEKVYPGNPDIFKGMYKPEEIVDTAQKYIDQGGKLNPTQGLMYRKAVDVLLKSKRYVKDELIAARGSADEIAKASENIATADPLFKRGIQAQSLRNIFPQNKYGGASSFKTAIITGLNAMGGPGKVLGALISPLAAGSTSTAAGVVTRVVGPAVRSPGLSVALEEFIRRRNQKSSSSSSME